MIVTSAGRGAAAAAGHSITMAATATTPVLRTGLPKFVVRQRRHSSSKQSNTPERTAAPVASEQQQASKKRDTSGNSSGSGENVGDGSRRKDSQGKAAKGGAGKNGGTKDKASSVVTQEPSRSADSNAVDAQAQLDNVAMPPSVPSTSHYDPKVVHLASIFAQHRPISLHQPVPPSEGKKAFESIFQPVTQRKRVQDVIFTLASAVKSLENTASTGNNKIVTPSPFDNAQVQADQGISLEELAKSFRPFKTPPPPVPMDPKYLTPEQQQQQQQAKPRQTKRKAQQAAMSSSVTPVAPLPESVAAELAAPAVVSTKAKEMQLGTIDAAATMPFRERMRARHETWLSAWLQRARQQWQLISVKRQRKLKMKKHKYKKFMRRTRNLRRRQDRL